MICKRIPPPPYLYISYKVYGNSRNLKSTYEWTLTTNHFFPIPLGFFSWKIRVAFPGDSQLRQSRATQPKVHYGCSNVSIINRTLTWITGSLPCAHMLMHAIVHGDVQTHVTESALKIYSESKVPCRTGESNLRQRRAGPTLYQLSYIPAWWSLSTLY